MCKCVQKVIASMILEVRHFKYISRATKIESTHNSDVIWALWSKITDNSIVYSSAWPKLSPGIKEIDDRLTHKFVLIYLARI